MSNKDYSELETHEVVNKLLDLHYSKLMSWEISTLEEFKLQNGKLTDPERDWLVGIYDRIGESGY